MRPLALALVLVAVSGCGTAGPEATPVGGISDAERNGARNALELLRGRYPALQVEETGQGLRLTIRRTGESPVVVIDGTRSVGTGEAVGIPPGEVAEIEVLTSMADTLIYGAEAARRGVVRITTRMGQRGRE
ncbi:hypothetical protein [Rubrivirga sp.]|uniref:hypothetical protein n=1 Tax=Rubrivirga sp. TaxID=1885344 RepID=UPI003B516348